ncbi:colicin V production protein [Dysgonomonas alginatilytica]|uniref:Colicin V production protein n=1 Tax=Dysgonomonas alginatilytica TaxID=1605892 RepID=A0A2V3PSG7_9BACT|nr:CvpA family protein [Dysgonomonas alginatilytica]PXV67545.1 colicin V production protein [Dysgonomonas alginatilytica]
MNWFDICIIIVIIYCIIKGYKTGLVKQLSTLAGLIVGAVLSGKLSILILPYVKHIKQIPDYMAAPLSYALTFLIIISSFYLLGTMMEEILKTVKMGTINKLAGIALCLTKWLFAISIAVNLIVQADEHHQLLAPKIRNGSATYKYIQPFAPKLVPFLKFSFD